MAMHIVHKLEAVEIDESKAYRKPLPSTALQFLLEHFIEVPNVVESSRIIRNCELLDTRYVVRIFDCNGGVIAKNMQKGDGVIAHLARSRIQDLDHALHPLASAQWHRDHRSHHAPVCGECLLQAGIVILRLWHDQRFAMLHHPA